MKLMEGRGRKEIYGQIILLFSKMEENESIK